VPDCLSIGWRLCHCTKVPVGSYPVHERRG